MNKSNLKAYAFAAGLIEGEGCITLKRKKAKQNTKHVTDMWVPFVEFEQTDGRLIDWLYGNFGGIVYKRKDREISINGSPKKVYLGSYAWQLDHKKCSEFLKKILPFLVYKKPQAELLIRYCSRLGHPQRDKKTGRILPLSEHEIKIRLKLKDNLKFLKKDFQESKVFLRKYNQVRAETERANISKDMKRQSNPLRN
jgi:hypothetical protein